MCMRGIPETPEKWEAFTKKCPEDWDPTSKPRGWQHLSLPGWNRNDDIPTQQRRRATRPASGSEPQFIRAGSHQWNQLETWHHLPWPLTEAKHTGPSSGKSEDKTHTRKNLQQNKKSPQPPPTA